VKGSGYAAHMLDPGLISANPILREHCKWRPFLGRCAVAPLARVTTVPEESPYFSEMSTTTGPAGSCPRSRLHWLDNSLRVQVNNLKYFCMIFTWVCHPFAR
jgi:hypothetical protein